MVRILQGDLATLLAAGSLVEDSQFEAKEAGGNIPGSVWSTISAFANTSGGAIVLGLREDRLNGIFEPVGVPNARQRLQDLANQLRDPRKISSEAVGSSDLFVESFENRDYIVINVERAPKRDRPVYLNDNREHAYVRRGEGDSRCTAAEIDRMRREATREGADRRVIESFSWDDFDPESITYFRQLALDANPDLPHHKLNDKEFLTRIDAWRHDRESGNVGPTFAGLLVFGREAAIREIRPTHVIDYRRIPADESATRRWTDRYRSTANLLIAWREIFPRLLRGLPTPFRLVDGQRQDRATGRESLREALANLLVHTDYEESADAVVFHYDDSYFFRNPGESWVNVDTISTEGRSERRNTAIADMFAIVGLADRAGSGFTRIFHEWASAGFKRPSVVSDPVRYEFSLTLSLASLLPTADREWLAALGGPWTEPEEIALAYAFHHECIDNQLLRNAAGIDMIEASKTLTNLRNQDVLRSVGSGRAVKYYLVSMPLPAGAPSAGGVTGSSAQDSISQQTYSDDKRVNQQTYSDNNNTSVESSGNTNLQKTLEAIAAPVARSQRARPIVVRRTILRLCEETPRTLTVLTKLMNRDAQTLRPHLNALIEMGILIPTQVQRHHPQQSYKTAPVWKEYFPEEEIS